MTFILFLLSIYFSVKMVKIGREQLKVIKFYSDRFTIHFPSNISFKEQRLYVHRLLQYDILTLPEEQLLDFVAARLRTINFPEGTILYRNNDSRLI